MPKTTTKLHPTTLFFRRQLHSQFEQHWMKLHPRREVLELLANWIVKAIIGPFPLDSDVFNNFSKYVFAEISKDITSCTKINALSLLDTVSESALDSYKQMSTNMPFESQDMNAILRTAFWSMSTRGYVDKDRLKVYLDAIKYLLCLGADANITLYGEPILSIAASLHPCFVELLFQHKANPNAKNQEEKPILQILHERLKPPIPRDSQIAPDVGASIEASIEFLQAQLGNNDHSQQALS